MTDMDMDLPAISINFQQQVKLRVLDKRSSGKGGDGRSFVERHGRLRNLTFLVTLGSPMLSSSARVVVFSQDFTLLGARLRILGTAPVFYQRWRGKSCLL
jgi:hypothetical protein